MNTKTLLAGLVGGVVGLVLAMLLWGMVLGDVMKENYNQCTARAEDDYVMWSGIVGNLLWGVALAIILSWAGVTTFMGGLTKTAMLSILLWASLDFQFWSYSTMFNSM